MSVEYGNDVFRYHVAVAYSAFQGGTLSYMVP